MRKIAATLLSTLSLAALTQGCTILSSPSDQVASLFTKADTGWLKLSNYDRGKHYLAVGDYGLAIDAFNDELARDAKSIPALNGIAIAYDRIGRPEVARSYLDRALALDGRSADTLNNIAYLDLSHGNKAEALNYFSRAKEALATAQKGDDSIKLATVVDNNAAIASAKSQATTPVVMPVAPQVTALEAAGPNLWELNLAKAAAKMKALPTVSSPAIPPVAAAPDVISSNVSDPMPVKAASLPSEPISAIPAPTVVAAPQAAAAAADVSDLRGDSTPAKAALLPAEPVSTIPAPTVVPASPTAVNVLDLRVDPMPVIAPSLSPEPISVTPAPSVVAAPKAIAAANVSNLRVDSAPAKAVSLPVEAVSSIPAPPTAINVLDLPVDRMPAKAASLSAEPMSAAPTVAPPVTTAANVSDVRVDPIRARATSRPAEPVSTIPSVVATRLTAANVSDLSLNATPARAETLSVSTAPTPTTESASTNAKLVLEQPFGHGKLTVRVDNATARYNMAHRFQRYLVSKGVPVNHLANSATRRYSTIFYSRGFESEAEALARLLPIPVRTVGLSNNYNAVELILAPDLIQFDQTLRVPGRT